SSQLRRANARSHCFVPARDGGRPSQQDFGRGTAAACCDSVCNWWSGGEQRAASDVRTRGRKRKFTSVFSIPTAFDGQRCHDRSRCVLEISGERFRCDGFFCRSRNGVEIAFSMLAFDPPTLNRPVIPTTFGSQKSAFPRPQRKAGSSSLKRFGMTDAERVRLTPDSCIRALPACCLRHPYL